MKIANNIIKAAESVAVVRHFQPAGDLMVARGVESQG